VLVNLILAVDLDDGMAAAGPVAPALAELVRPHIDSFNWFITEGIKRVVDLLEPVEVKPPQDCLYLHSMLTNSCMCTTISYIWLLYLLLLEKRERTLLVVPCKSLIDEKWNSGVVSFCVCKFSNT
jgi:hypothetical protein